jgi:hypothetical protein
MYLSLYLFSWINNGGSGEFVDRTAVQISIFPPIQEIRLMATVSNLRKKQQIQYLMSVASTLDSTHH